VIEILDLYPQIIQDYRRGIAKEIISARFHNTIAQTCLFAAQEIQKFTNINVVALSGGVWQNLTLLTKSLHLLKSHGFKPLIHRKIPTNDGGISIGQILVASTIING
jgi:hydrogenase maturation protein HypF